MADELKRFPWRPLLVGESGERAREVVADIALSLCESAATLASDVEADFFMKEKLEDVSLARGCAGLAILYAYLARARSEANDEETAVDYLNRAVNAVSDARMNPSLYGGFTGVAWAVEHLQGRLLEPDGDLNESVDEALKTYLNQSPWQDDYDLISGLVGIGVYALERLSHPSAIGCLERIVDRLDETAEHNEDGVTWLTRPHLLPDWQREQCPNGYYNLGLAHGVPGVIALLGGVCAAGVSLEKARPLLDGAVAGLLRQKLTSTARSSFSSWIGHSGNRDDCRLAWCYGDAGVVAALLVAARCVNERKWEREALNIARRAAARAPESAGVKDAGLCHGAAGLGHIFNRLFQTTGESGFREAARYWFERTLELMRPGQGIGGFSAYRPSVNGGEAHWEDEVGILEGAAGIALALLAAATNIEPEWDRMLLVSNPNR